MKHVGSRTLLLIMFIFMTSGIFLTSSAWCRSDGEIYGGFESSDWWTEVRQSIKDSEYCITFSDEVVHKDIGSAYQAPNRRNDFRTYFPGSGVVFTPRKKSQEGWLCRIELSGMGRGERFEQVSAPDVNVVKNRLEYCREGLVEWYANEEKGLEQGFTLLNRSFENDGEGRFYLELAVTGDLSPSARCVSVEAIELRDGSGKSILRYGELYVADAVGRELESSLSVTENGAIRLYVDDAGAEYPIFIDPYFTAMVLEPLWTAEGDQDYEWFGYSTESAGDVNGDGYEDVIVGAPRYDCSTGRAVLFHGSATGPSSTPSWTKIGESSSKFGYSVSPAGDVNSDGYDDVIVGAPGSSCGIPGGAAYVYHGSPSGLNSSHAWSHICDQWTYQYGYSVNTAGDVDNDGYDDVIVGVNYYGMDNSGYAYVYHGSASGLSAAADWEAGDYNDYEEFGTSVSTAGDINNDGYDDVIVGAPRYTSCGNGSLEDGRAYLYHGTSSGLETNYSWAVSCDDSWSYFGSSVSSAGDVNNDSYDDVLVGARDYGRYGKVFCYLGSDTGLSGTPDWSVEGPPSDYGQFGAGLAAGRINDDDFNDVIIGMEDYAMNNGAAFVYYGTADGPADLPACKAYGGYDAKFGCSVGSGDFDGDGLDDIIVGALRYGDNSGFDPGRVVMFNSLNFTTLEMNPWWSYEGEQEEEHLGFAVASAGDVDNDGYDDIIVGAPHYDTCSNNVGRVFVFHGSETGPGTSPNWTQYGDDDSPMFGYSVASAGDVDNDDFADVVIGAIGATCANPGGSAFVYHGSSSGLSGAPNWTDTVSTYYANFGCSVNCAGDVNDDGYDDVIIGARYSGNDCAGHAYVYHGSPAGLNSSPGWQAGNYITYEDFGEAVAGAGDVNADGYDDVIVGAPYYSSCGCGGSESGHAYVFHGSSSGVSPTYTWLVTSDWYWSEFGYAVSGAGDVDNDGYDDVVVGARSYGCEAEGKVYLFGGSSAGLETAPSWEKMGDMYGEFGSSLAGNADINNDEYADVIIGMKAWNYNNGAVYAFAGSAEGLENEPVCVSYGYDEELGWAVDTGDVDGNGIDDIIVGSRLYSKQNSSQIGKVSLFSCIPPVPTPVPSPTTIPTPAPVPAMGGAGIALLAVFFGSALFVLRKTVA